MSNVKNSIPFLLCLVATVQIFAIGEKLFHALWQWYKFQGTGGNGHTTFSAEMFWMTIIFSFFGITASYLLLKHLDGNIGTKLARLSGTTMSLGLFILVILVLSPLARFR